MKRTNVSIGLNGLLALMIGTTLGCNSDNPKPLILPPESFASRDDPGPFISPAESFALDSAVIADLQKRAAVGDCDAAARIAHHHSYFTLDLPEMVKWFRVAARCPSPHVKGELVATLIFNYPYETVADEVETVMAEMRELDPEYTKEFVVSMKLYGYKPNKKALEK